MGLAPVRDVLAALGNPQARPSTVLVAGTNGKGSTAAMLASVASAAGYRTGLYTSPHLEAVRERLRFNGRAIEDARLVALLREVVNVAERCLGEPPTYFEALTLAGFLWFARQEAELAVLEVGMGGRLDATNACDPLLSIITSIGLDHRERLGSTTLEIAGEKAGVMRRGRPTVAWLEDPVVREAVGQLAENQGAELIEVSGESGGIEPPAAHGAGKPGAGEGITLQTPADRYRIVPPLQGQPQLRNLWVAVRSAELLARRGFSGIDRNAIVAGVSACRWPGRMEEVTLPGGRRVLLDAAHNASAVEALASDLSQRGEAFDLLFGALSDKDAEAMLRCLVPLAGRVVLTRAPSERAIEPAQLAGWVTDFAGRTPVVEPAVGDALAGALRPGRLLLVTGSIYLVGDVRTRLRQEFGVPPPAADG